jgi:predicted ATPase/class 3 adenylate cyclase
MPELPSGTVTFLFTDIEGSTRLLHELGEAYAEVLAEHRRAVREAFLQHGGIEVDTQGDAFFVAFARASDAVLAASAIQDALAAGPTRVRIGIHTGEPVVTDEGYIGVDVHRAARIMGAAHGGQVLLSETTARLLDSAAELRDLGEHRLKDLSAPQRLHQLGNTTFPPPRTLYRTNLPIQPTPLVGRERELAEAGALLRRHRLLTLTGPGGSGKTRLALQLAAEAVEQFPDGVYWAPLQALRDPALLERALASAVGADDGLAEYVGDKRLLLLVDNFEQVIEAAPTVSALLAATPQATLLVTSREPLQLEPEQRYPVEPLPQDDAAVLFVERARAVVPGFRPAAAVGEICRRLDGLPLAIELAAARVALLDPDELLARLDRRLPLLASRSRAVPARQRTLRATIEWSYELLDPAEQELFRRLAVFQGTFSLEAAEAVCAAELETLESLLVKNLVRRWGSGRLGMLDTIREYALERLDDSPEAEELHRRHADYVLALLQDANLTSPKLDARRPMRFDVALAEQDNLRGALDWTLRSGAIALGLELATAADWFWGNQDPNEGMRWFRRLFEHPEAEAVAPETRAYALCCYGGSTGISGDFEGAEPLWEQSLALFDQLGDEHGRAVLLHRLSANAMVRGDLERARRLLEQSHAIHARKTEPLTRAFRLAETTGALGAVARDAGDDERAYALISDSLSAARQSGVEWWEGKMLAELAALFLRAGRVEDAEAHARESLGIADRLRDIPGCVFGVGLLACVAAEQGESERAGRLWGAIEDKVAAAPLGGWQRHREACAARMGKAAGPEFDRGRDAGRTLTLDDAVSLALAPPDVEATAASPTPDQQGSG